MKKIISFFTINLIFVLSVFSQIPDWSVNPSNFSYNMTVTGVLYIDQVETLNENNIVAAFVGDECRAVSYPIFNQGVNRYVFYMMIFSNSTNETLTFKAYNSDNDEVVELLNSFNFQINGLVGNAEAPYFWTNTVLSNAAEMLSYNIPLQISQNIVGQNINIIMPLETDLTDLTAEFSISDLANSFIGITPQVSGETSNDFSNPLIYRVFAQNGDYKDWTINVTKITSNNELENSNFLIYPNPTNGIFCVSSNSIEIENIYLTDITGKTLENFKTTEINISNYNSGVYFIKIQTLEQNFVFKIIKQ